MNTRAHVTVLAVLIAICGIPDAAGAGGSLSNAGVGGGMGVSTVHAYDLAGFVTAVTLERVPDFRTAVEFFGAADVPVGEQWIVTVEYAYLLGGYDASGSLGRAEFTMKAHMPTLIVQYALADEVLYNLRVGAGAGYHFGILSMRYSTLDDDYTGHGPGFKLQLEGNTALGDDLFVRLGVDARWDFIGDLTNSAGMGPQAVRDTPPPTLDFFALGAKIGLTWYF